MSIPLEDLERKNKPTIFDSMSKLSLPEKIRFVITLFQYHPKVNDITASPNETKMKNSATHHTPRR